MPLGVFRKPPHAGCQNPSPFSIEGSRAASGAWAPLESLVSFGVLWGPLGSFGVLWRPLGFFGVLWGSLGSLGVLGVLGVFGCPWVSSGPWGSWGPWGPEGPWILGVLDWGLGVCPKPLKKPRRKP